jgi:hypothetical protein
MFSLLKPTFVTLSNLNTRVEKHGDESMSAIDLSISYDAPNTILDAFQPGLLDAFYKAAEAGDDSQATMDGFEISAKPLLRFHHLGVQKLSTELVGHRLEIEYGIDEEVGIVLPTVNVKKFALELKEGGTVSMKFLVQTSTGLTEQIIGKLAMLISQDVRVMLTPPQMVQPEDDEEPGLVLPGMDEEDKPLTAEDVFTAGVIPGSETAAVH